jgi:hypothetical protein
MNTVEQMTEEILMELSNGVDLDNIKDRSGEIVDGYLPVYYSEIIREWQHMPNEYNDRGWAELSNGSEFTIYTLMSLDLYIYYHDLFSEAMAKVESELSNA